MPFNPGNVKRLNALGGKRPQATGIVLIPKNGDRKLRTSEGSVNNFGGNSKFGLYPNVGMNYKFQNRYLTGTLFNTNTNNNNNTGGNSPYPPVGSTVFVRNPTFADSVNFENYQATYGNITLPSFKGRIYTYDENVDLSRTDEDFVAVTFQFRRQRPEYSHPSWDDDVGFMNVNPVPLAEPFVETWTLRNCSRAYADNYLNYIEKRYALNFPGQEVILSAYYTGTFLSTPLPIKVYKRTYNYASKFADLDQNNQPVVGTWHEDHPDNAGAAAGEYASGEGPFSFTQLYFYTQTTDSMNSSYLELNDNGHITGFNARPIIESAGLQDLGYTQDPWFGQPSEILLNGVGHEDLYDGDGNLLVEAVTTGQTLQIFHADAGIFREFANGIYPRARKWNKRLGDRYMVAAGEINDGSTVVDHLKGGDEMLYVIATGFDPSTASPGATIAGGTTQTKGGSGTTQLAVDTVFLNGGDEWDISVQIA